MIRGSFDGYGRPTVEAQVDIPRLNLSYNATFILDTGADATCLHFKDVVAAQINVSELRKKSKKRRLGGVGGSREYRLIPATLVFKDAETSGTLSYPIDLLVRDNMSSDPSELRLPSLLGRDIIDLHDMTYSRRLNRLEIRR